MGEHKHKITLDDSSQSAQQFISQLAQELAYNYASVTFDDNIGGDYTNKIDLSVFDKNIAEGKELEERLRAKKDEKKAVRNVLIIGAGASFHIYDKLLLADFAVVHLVNALKIKELLNNSGLKGRVENLTDYYTELKHIRVSATSEKDKKKEKQEQQEIVETDEIEALLTRIKKLDFESALSLLSQIVSTEEIRTVLKKLYGSTNRPSLMYEIIAHLFKHRFLDVIINFNFDELLDQSIEEELGISNYNYIISDGHCRDIEELIVADRLKVPLYIKPHGTTSHKSTMRFTKDQYFDLPTDISNMLKDVLSGTLVKPKGDQQGKALDQVNLIVLGFNMQSIEFNSILKKYLPKGSEIYYVGHSEPPTLDEFVDVGLFEKDKVHTVLLKEVQKEPWFKQGYLDRMSILDNLFYRLWLKIEEVYDVKFKPRNIARHLITASIFYNKKVAAENREDNAAAVYHYLDSLDYLKDRVIIELFIALLKHGGVVEIRKLMNQRMGEYFQKYLNLLRTKTTKDHTFQAMDFVHFYELEEKHSFARTVYNSPRINGKSIQKELEKSFERILQQEYKGLKLSEGIKENMLKNKKNILAAVSQIAGKSSMEINARFNDRNLFIFDHFNKKQILHTNLSLRYRYQEILHDKAAWDIMLVISESGGVLNKFTDPEIETLFSKKEFFLLTTDLHPKNPFIQSFEEKVDKFYVECLPYWDHDHHMVVFIKKEKRGKGSAQKKYTFVRSIYFKKSALSTRINPIYINNDDLNYSNHCMLVEAFYASWLKAKEYGKSKTNSERKILHIENSQSLYDWNGATPRQEETLSTLMKEIKKE